MKTLSLCMIVKNEEDLLEDCLSWHKDLVDEIIIVDTGSIDSSKEIALKFTDKIHDFKWCDDFSAARNYSLSFASGDWILVLDADEKLSPEDQAHIRQLIEHSTPEAYQLIQRSYTNDSALYGFQLQNSAASENAVVANTLGYFDTPIVRLIPNLKELGLRYVQRIHEGIEYEDANKRPRSSSLVLHHYGALKKEEQLQKKKQLYYDLEKIRFEENPNDPEGLRQYGSACLEFKEWKKALDCFESAQKLEPHHGYHFFGKALAFYHLKHFDLCENVLKEGLRLDTENTPLLRFLSVLLLEIKKTEEAERFFQTYILKNPQDTELRAQFVSRYMQQGELKKALKLLEQILQLNPTHENSLYNAGVLFKHLGQKELALEMMQKLSTLKPEDEEVKQKILEWQKS